MNRSKLVAAGLLFAAFAAGAAVGGAVSAAWGENDVAAPIEPEEPPRRKSYAERLQEDLALTPAQRDSVDAILGHVEPDMHALWEEIAPRFDSLRSAVRRDIVAILDEQQRQTYADLIARGDSAKAARHGRKNEERRGRRHEDR